VSSSGDLDLPADVRWRVGHVSDPVGFVPRERCSWNHRFDDPHHRFRTLYCAIRPETALREVLADLRRNTGEVAHYLQVFGEHAAADLPAEEVTADWRRQNVLAPCRIATDGKILDLTDAGVRHETERRHAALLAAHGMAHLDFTEVTLRRRAVTREIAADAYDDLGCAGLRFPSRLDGLPCYALFEGRAYLDAAGAPIPLTDPPPAALEDVAAGWGLNLQPTPVTEHDGAQ
jgi:RES domain